MSMAVQTSYNFGFAKGVAGGLFDLSAHEVSTRQAEGYTTFGVGVVTGTNKGIDVKAPESSSKSNDFEGVIVHNSIMTELDKDNKVVVEEKKTVGVLQHGKIWVKTGEKAVPAYKEKAYLITDGKEAGLFTTASDAATTKKIEVNGIFLGTRDNGIAVVQFFSGITTATD